MSFFFWNNQVLVDTGTQKYFRLAFDDINNLQAQYHDTIRTISITEMF